MKNLLFAGLMAVATLTACKQEIKSLPDITQTGANTFGAKVNGENFGPLGGSLITKPTLEATHTFDSSITIDARNFSRMPIEFEMQIFLKHVSGPGTYSLNQETEIAPGQTASYAYYVRRNINITDEWITSSNATGTVEVSKIDWTNRIVSGTFAFTANAKRGSAPITVTEGRFDVRFQ